MTQKGNRREVVEQMFSRLQQAKKKELLAIGYAIALRSLKDIDRQWLEELFMNEESIFEGTGMEDFIYQKGVTKGLEQGVKQGLEQGSLLSQRATLVSFVKARFPDQLALAEQQAKLITTPSQAQELLDKLFAAHTNDEVREILLSLPHA